MMEKGPVFFEIYVVVYVAVYVAITIVEKMG